MIVKMTAQTGATQSTCYQSDKAGRRCSRIVSATQRQHLAPAMCCRSSLQLEYFKLALHSNRPPSRPRPFQDNVAYPDLSITLGFVTDSIACSQV